MAAAALIPIVHACLKTIGARRTRRIFECAQAPAPEEREADAIARTIAGAVARASRRGAFRGNCFSQSIVLMRLLGQHGIDAELRFGARMQGSALDAHAWVERNGVPLNDSPLVTRRFAPLVAGNSKTER